MINGEVEEENRDELQNRGEEAGRRVMKTDKNNSVGSTLKHNIRYLQDWSEWIIIHNNAMHIPT